MGDDWVKIELGKLCKLKSGFAFRSSNFLVDGIPLVKISNIQNLRTVVSNSDVYIDPKYLPILTPFVLNMDNVVIAMSGATTGKVGKVTSEFCPSFLNQRVGLFQPISETKISSEYIFQYFSQTTVVDFILKSSGTSAQPNISSGFIEGIEIHLPKSTIEQQAIANILSKVDEAIAQTQALIAKYTRIKTGLMQDLLTKGIDENGNIRSEETHEFKDSPLGRIPKEWECENLSKISDISRGKFTPRPRNNPIYYNGDFPFIQTGDISNCKELYLNNFTQTLNEKGILVSKKFPIGSIVMTIAANIGDTAILAKEMYLTDSVVGIIPRINEIYFELFLRNIKKQLENLATQSAQKNINLQKLNEVFIKFPTDINEQERISKKYISIINSIKSLEVELLKLQSLKRGLMQDLLSGKVRTTSNA